MASSTLFIPEKINVGYQKRNDTYTGKLAYVVYTDQKGKLRKEVSWNRWCDDKIGKNEFKNEPMDGFVLNKKVGDYSSRWGGRRAHIRIYDPRGFEFEIGVDNLLFILEECSAIKGKGLEGEFVYSWDKKELVLLPVTCQEYKESKEYTKLQGKKVGKADIVPGCWYKTKDNEEIMYLGREKIYNHHRRLPRYSYANNNRKVHIFLYKHPGEDYNGNKVLYFVQTNYRKIAERVTDQPDVNFATYYEDFKNGPNGSAVASIRVDTVDDAIVSKKRDYYRKFFFRHDGTIYRGEIKYGNMDMFSTYEKIKIAEKDIVGTYLKQKVSSWINYERERKDFKISDVELLNIYYILENGCEISIEKNLRSRKGATV